MVFRIFKREIYKNLLHRPTIMLVLGAIIIALMINRIGGIYTKTEINRRYSQYSVAMVATAVGIDVSEFDGETEIENVILKHQFPTVFKQTSSGLCWVSILFMALFICNEFHERGFESMLEHGATKRSIFWVKWLSASISFWVTSMLVLLVMLFRYTLLKEVPSHLLFQNILLYSVIVSSHGALCILIAILFRNVLWTSGVTFIVILIQSVFPLRNPIQMLSNEVLWTTNTKVDLIKTAVNISLGQLVVCTIIACLAFQIMDLKREV